MPSIDLEIAARAMCPHCERGFQMDQREEKGHTLRFRKDTQEWVHDFIKDTSTETQKREVFDHKFCQANELRKKHGG